MYVIEVVPLLNLPRFQPQILSYFSSRNLNFGSLVEISLGKRSGQGLVIKSRPIESKIHIKKADFSLKPITRVINTNSALTFGQWDLIKWLSDYYFLSLSGLLKNALANPRLLTRLSLCAGNTDTFKDNKLENYYLFHDDFSFLKEKIKQTISHNKQILIIVPNQIKLEIYQENLKEFEKELVVFDKQLTIKKLLAAYDEISSNDRKIILGKRSSIFAPFNNLGLIVVVDEENSALETWETKIHFNSKIAAFHLSKLFNCPIFLVSSTPSVESYSLIKEGLFQTTDKPSDINWSGVNVVESKNIDSEVIFHPEVIEKISDLIKNSGKILILANRRGFSPALVCKECGYIEQCPNCAVALVYHYLPPTHELRCHHCGFQSKPKDICPNCGGHIIKFLGTGSQKVFNILSKKFPEAEIKEFNSDVIKTFKKEWEVFDQFINSSSPQILIVTELFLKFLDITKEKIDLSIIISAEQMLIFPDFRGEERLRRIIQRIAAVSKQVSIQAIDPKKEFFENIMNLDKFYQNELRLRRQLVYPPYASVAKIEFSHRNEKMASRLAERAHQIIQKNAPRLFQNDYVIFPPISSFIPKVKNKYIKEIFWKIKIANNLLMPSEIASGRNKILDLLDSEAVIKIDPIDLL